MSDPLAILEDIGVVSGETIRDYTPEKGWKIKDSDKMNIITIDLWNHHQSCSLFHLDHLLNTLHLPHPRHALVLKLSLVSTHKKFDTF